MFCEKRGERLSIKNATSNVDVLTIDIFGFVSGCIRAIVNSVCQDVTTPTNNSIKSIVVITINRCVSQERATHTGMRLNGLYQENPYKSSGVSIDNCFLIRIVIRLFRLNFVNYKSDCMMTL